MLDLWLAKTEAPSPLVLYIHGGGFRSGDKNTLSPSCLPFYDITAEEIDTEEAYRRYEAMAPITHLGEGDPPVMMSYSYPNTLIEDAEAHLGLVVHHPLFGIALKEHMDALGIECVVQYRDGPEGPVVRHGEEGRPESEIDFIRRHFEAAAR